MLSHVNKPIKVTYSNVSFNQMGQHSDIFIKINDFLGTHIMSFVEFTIDWESVSKISLLNILLNRHLNCFTHRKTLNYQTVSNLFFCCHNDRSTSIFTTYPVVVDLVECLLKAFKLIFTQSLGGGFTIQLVQLLFFEFV